MKICPQCQQKLGDEAKFCSFCGYSFIDTEDPYSEDYVHPVNLPGEEFNDYDEDYTEDYQRAPEVERTVVAPIRASRRPGYVQKPATSYSSPRKKSSSVLNGILVAISFLLIIAIFGVLYMIFSSSNPLESLTRSKSVGGPTILQAPKEEKPAKVGAASSNAESKTKEEAKPEKKEESKKDPESQKALSQIYSEIEKESKNISRTISVFDESHTKSLAEREQERAKVQDDISKLSEFKKSVENTKVSDDFKDNKKKQLKLIDLNIQRLKVLDKAYGVSLQYEDASEHKDEILKPFRNAYRDGTSRSKYLLEYEETYPEANPDK